MDERLKAYRTADILGKNQLDLVLQVYDGAIMAFQETARLYLDKQYDRGYEQLIRARRFVTHLYTTLNPEAGGEIALNLGKLYAFILSQSAVAEATKDAKLLDENIRLLKDLREAWARLKTQRKSAQSEPSKAANISNIAIIG